MMKAKVSKTNSQQLLKRRIRLATSAAVACALALPMATVPKHAVPVASAAYDTTSSGKYYAADQTFGKDSYVAYPGLEHAVNGVNLTNNFQGWDYQFVYFGDGADQGKLNQEQGSAIVLKKYNAADNSISWEVILNNGAFNYGRSPKISIAMPSEKFAERPTMIRRSVLKDGGTGALQDGNNPDGDAHWAGANVDEIPYAQWETPGKTRRLYEYNAGAGYAGGNDFKIDFELMAASEVLDGWAGSKPDGEYTLQKQMLEWVKRGDLGYIFYDHQNAYNSVGARYRYQFTTKLKDGVDPNNVPLIAGIRTETNGWERYAAQGPFDTDRDGFTDKVERRENTNPLDINEKPQPQVANVTAPRHIIGFAGETNTYPVQVSGQNKGKITRLFFGDDRAGTNYQQENDAAAAAGKPEPWAANDPRWGFNKLPFIPAVSGSDSEAGKYVSMPALPDGGYDMANGPLNTNISLSFPGQDKMAVTNYGPNWSPLPGAGDKWVWAYDKIERGLIVAESTDGLIANDTEYLKGKGYFAEDPHDDGTITYYLPNDTYPQMNRTLVSYAAQSLKGNPTAPDTLWAEQGQTIDDAFITSRLRPEDLKRSFQYSTPKQIVDELYPFTDGATGFDGPKFQDLSTWDTTYMKDFANTNPILINESNPVDLVSSTPVVENGKTVAYDTMVKVNYADGSSDTVPMRVMVAQQDADRSQPVGKPLTVEQGATVTPEQLIENINGPAADGTPQLQNVKSYEFVTPPNTANIGVQNAVVKVTYNDGSSDEITVPVTVTKKLTRVDDSAVQAVNPTADEQSTGVKIVNKDDETKLTVLDEDDQPVPYRIDADGNIFVTPGVGVDGPIYVTITDPDLPNGFKTVKVPVNGHQEGVNDDISVDSTGKVPSVDPTDTEQDTGIKVVNPTANTTVEATDEDGNPVKGVRLDPSTGKIYITPGASVDGPITVVIKDPGLPGGQVTEILEVTGHTASTNDNATSVSGTPVTVNPTADEQGTGIVVKNKDADTVITVKDEDGKDIPFTVDPVTGEIMVTPGTDVDGPLKVTITDPELPDGKAEYTVPVTGHTAGVNDNPTSVSGTPVTVNPTADEQGTGIVVKNKDADTVITVKDEDGKDIPFTVDPVTGEIKVTPGTDVDGPITVTITDPELPGGKAEYTVPVAGHTAGKDDNGNGKPGTTTVDTSGVKPVQPSNDPQDTGVVVNPPAGSTATATDEDGKTIPVTIDPVTGKVTVTPGTDVDGPITVVITLPNGETVTVKIPVSGHTEGKDDNGNGKPGTNTGAVTTVDSTGVKPVNPSNDSQGTGVIVKNPDGGTTVTATDEDGKDIPVNIDPVTGEITVVPGTDVDGPITVVIKDPDLPGGQVEIKVPVAGHTEGKDDNVSVDESGKQPVQPTDDAQDTGVVVKNPSTNTEVKAHDEDGKDIPVTLDPVTGKITVTPGTDVDGPVTVTITDPALPGGTTTVIVDVVGHTAGTDDNANGKPGTTTVDSSGVKPVDPTNGAQDTGIVVTNPSADTTVTATDEDGKTIPVTIDPVTGKVTVTPGTDVDGPITVVIKDGDLPGGQVEIKVPVNGHTEGVDDSVSVDESGKKPVNPTNDAQDTGVVVKNPGTATTVTAKDEDGKDIPVTLDPVTGKITVTPGTDVDGPITVVINNPALPGGTKTVFVDVVGHTAGKDDNGNGKPGTTTVDTSGVKPVQPSNDPQDTGVVVNPPAGSTATATDEDGKSIPVTIDPVTGKVTVTPGTDVDGPITVVITLPNGETVTVKIPVAGHTEGKDDNGNGKPGTVGVNTDNVKSVDPTDQPQDTGVVITNPTKDTTVTATDEDGKSIPVTVDPVTGKVTITPGTNVDGPITVVIKDPSLPGGQKVVEIPVKGHTKGHDDNGNGRPSELGSSQAAAAALGSSADSTGSAANLDRCYAQGTTSSLSNPFLWLIPLGLLNFIKLPENIQSDIDRAIYNAIPEPLRNQAGLTQDQQRQLVSGALILAGLAAMSAYVSTGCGTNPEGSSFGFFGDIAKDNAKPGQTTSSESSQDLSRVNQRGSSRN